MRGVSLVMPFSWGWRLSLFSPISESFLLPNPRLLARPLRSVSPGQGSKERLLWAAFPGWLHLAAPQSRWNKCTHCLHSIWLSSASSRPDFSTFLMLSLLGTPTLPSAHNVRRGKGVCGGKGDRSWWPGLLRLISAPLPASSLHLIRSCPSLRRSQAFHKLPLCASPHPRPTYLLFREGPPTSPNPLSFFRAPGGPLCGDHTP